MLMMNEYINVSDDITFFAETRGTGLNGSLL